MQLLEILQQQFFLRALYGGLLVAVLCAILGIFVTLKKETFISDAVAHASLAGVALGLVLGVYPLIFAIATALLLAILITYFKKRTYLGTDSLIGIFYTFLFAIGLLIINNSNNFRAELSSYLFGSILAISWNDIILIFSSLAATLVVVFSLYSQIVYSTLDPEGAQIRGIRTNRIEYLINILTSVAIIVSIKVVGIILVTALLVIPSSSARLLAKSFKQMLPISIAHSLLSVVGGIFIAYYLDAPVGPSIIIFSTSIFLLLFLVKRFFN